MPTTLRHAAAVIAVLGCSCDSKADPTAKTQAPSPTAAAPPADPTPLCRSATVEVVRIPGMAKDGLGSISPSRKVVSKGRGRTRRRRAGRGRLVSAARRARTEMPQDEDPDHPLSVPPGFAPGGTPNYRTAAIECWRSGPATTARPTWGSQARAAGAGTCCTPGRPPTPTRRLATLATASCSAMADRRPRSSQNPAPSFASHSPSNPPGLACGAANPVGCEPRESRSAALARGLRVPLARVGHDFSVDPFSLGNLVSLGILGVGAQPRER